MSHRFSYHTKVGVVMRRLMQQTDLLHNRHNHSTVQTLEPQHSGSLQSILPLFPHHIRSPIMHRYATAPSPYLSSQTCPTTPGQTIHCIDMFHNPDRCQNILYAKQTCLRIHLIFHSEQPYSMKDLFNSLSLI